MIEVTNVVKRYGPATVLNGATFQIAEAQLTTILGPLELKWRPVTRS